MHTETRPETRIADTTTAHEIALIEHAYRSRIKVGKGALNAARHPLRAIDRNDLIYRAQAAATSAQEQIRQTEELLENPRVRVFLQRALLNLASSEHIEEVRYVASIPAHEYYKYRAISDEAQALVGIAAAIHGELPTRVCTIYDPEHLEDICAATSRLDVYYAACGVTRDARQSVGFRPDGELTQVTPTNCGVSLVEQYEQGYDGVPVMVVPGVVIPRHGAYPPQLSLAIAPDAWS
jgi:hypothetical protein